MIIKRNLPSFVLWLTAISFFCLFLFGAQVVQAASGSYGWTRASGGTGEDWGGQDIAVDSSGNVFFTGGFESTVDFDGTSGTDNHTASGSYADIFITKYNADGSYGWTKTFGGTAEDYGQGIATDTDETSS